MPASTPLLSTSLHPLFCHQTYTHFSIGFLSPLFEWHSHLVPPLLFHGPSSVSASCRSNNLALLHFPTKHRPRSLSVHPLHISGLRKPHQSLCALQFAPRPQKHNIVFAVQSVPDPWPPLPARFHQPSADRLQAPLSVFSISSSGEEPYSTPRLDMTAVSLACRGDFPESPHYLALLPLARSHLA